MEYKRYQYYINSPEQIKEIIDNMYRDGAGITIKNVIKRCGKFLLEEDNADIQNFVDEYRKMLLPTK